LSTKRRSGKKSKKTSGAIPFVAFPDKLKKGVSSLNAFVGKDVFLRGACVRVLCEALEEDGEPCSPAMFEGGTCAVAAVLDELKTLPMLEEKRIVWVEGADRFIKDAAEVLDEWPKLGEHSILILTDAKLDARRKLTKHIFTNGTVVDCDSMEESGLKKWMTRRIEDAGKQAAAAVTTRMLRRVGGSAAALDQAVEQLITFTGSKTDISPTDVDEAIPIGTFEEVWALVGAMGTRNTQTSLEVLDDLLSHGEEALAILGAVGWHIRRLLSAKYLMEAGVTQQNIFRKLRVFPSQHDDFRTILKNFGFDDAKKNLSLLIETDVLLKSSPKQQHRLVMETTVMQMCN
jgi:DNA polymerase III delta subunit